MSITLKIIITGILLLFSIVFGFWLSNIGKPYNNALFSIHKIIAVATVILFILIFIYLFKNFEVKNIKFVLIIICGISIMSLIITGALLSIGNSNYQLFKYVHLISSIFTVISSSSLIYLILKQV